MPRRSKVARLEARAADTPRLGSHADVLDRRPNRAGSPIGRPTALTPDREEAIIRAVLAGNHLVTACALAGISKTTLFRWIDRATQADTTLETTGHVPDGEQPFRDFRDRLAQARAYAEHEAVRVVTKSMHGGAITSEKPATNENGEVLRDDNGEILYERTYTAPDGRLALSYLAKSRPDQWGNNPTRIEIVGAGDDDGGAPSGGASNLLAVAERIAIAAKQVRSEPLYTSDGTAVDPEDVVDAEYTEEPDGSPQPGGVDGGA